MGDSMTKFIDARNLRHSTKMKIAVKTFPGARTEDMIHYVKPTLSKQPSQLIIHVGTNDLSSKSQTEIVKSIAVLGDAIKTEDPNIDLTFSEVIARNDEKALADKVNFVNKHLDKLCTQRNENGTLHLLLLAFALDEKVEKCNKVFPSRHTTSFQR